MPLTRTQHDRMANAIRALAMDAVEQAKSGHPGLPMGAADIATVLFTRFLKFDPADPTWPDRDRFVLSAGHGSMLIYALLHLLGYEAMTIEEIKRFRQLGSLTPGHPENFITAGIETTTGPLGQGLGNAVGMAIAERHLAAVFGPEVVDHRTYVLASDGDLMEGISQEAIALAGHLKLSKLIVLFDDNGISIDGPLSLSDSVDQVKRFEAAGWAATRVDGHDPAAIAVAIAAAQASERPSLIACRTTIGFGAPSKAGTEKSHGSPLGADEIKGARERLGWPEPPFVIPADVLALWRSAGKAGKTAHHSWRDRFKALASARRTEFERRLEGELPKDELAAAVRAAKEKLAAAPKEIATRAASESALEGLTAAVPEMIGGSADLTGSNNTRPKGMAVLSAADYSGRFIHYGVREHGMASAMNGMSLHGGIIPYSGTFLVFSDYCRPAIRLAALAGMRVIHVMTHDSIGLGEDGPTHQPVEHLAALRAIPNLYVFRPCDAVETVECWELALQNAHGPSVLALTRQNLPQLRLGYDNGNRCAAGAYEIAPAEKKDARGLAVRDRIGSRDRGRGAQAAARARRRCARRFGALLRALPRPSCRRAAESPGNGQGQSRGRGRNTARLGRNHRLGRRFCRHDFVRRERAGQGAVQTFRDHAAKGRRGGAGQTREDLKSSRARLSKVHAAGKTGGKGERRSWVMSVRVAINGFGRIGRNVLRAIAEADRGDIEVVAINDLAPVETNAHLLRFDSVHGRFPREVKVSGDSISVGNGMIKVTAIKDPATLPWKELGIDIALECTGIFTSKEKAAAHLTAGAKRVIISAPADGADLTVVYGVNHDKLTKEHKVVSNASCTTNCLAPVAKVLNDAVGIDKGFMTTVHSYTNDQPSLDQVHKDLYRARAAALNMIPTSTGAAKAVGLVLPELAGKLDGVAIRVPTPNVSVVDFKFVAKRATSKDEINNAVKRAADQQLKGILGYTEAPNVSSDFNHDPHSSIFAIDQTKVMDGTLVRVMSWYDNEWGFSNRMVDTAVAMGKLI